MSTQHLLLQSCYQIEAMAFALQKAARDEDVDALPYLVQSLSIRIVELNGVLMGVALGETSDADSMRDAVFGKFRKIKEVEVAA